MHNLVTSKHHDSIVVVVITLGTLLQWTKNSSKGSSSWSDPSFHFILEQAYPSLSLCDFDGSVAVNPNCPQMLGNSSVSLIMVIGRRERENWEEESIFKSFFSDCWACQTCHLQDRGELTHPDGALYGTRQQQQQQQQNRIVYGSTSFGGLRCQVMQSCLLGSGLAYGLFLFKAGSLTILLYYNAMLYCLLLHLYHLLSAFGWLARFVNTHPRTNISCILYLYTIFQIFDVEC